MKTLQHLLNYVQGQLWDDLLGSVQPSLSEPNASPTPIQPPTIEPSLRSIVLHHCTVAYRIERTRRKTIGMLIDEQGLRVRAAPRVSVAEIEGILRSKADWIIKHLHKAQIRAQLPVAKSFVPNLQLTDGESIRVLGRSMRLRWGNAIYVPEYSLDMDAAHSEVWAKRPRDMARPEHVAQAIEAALDAYLLKFLHARAQHHARAHGLNYRDIVLSSARTTWGTCRRDGLIRINWRLVFLDAQLVDYVLAHELAHTVHMNHSPKFWQQVGVLCPDYLHLRKQMKQYDLRNS